MRDFIIVYDKEKVLFYVVIHNKYQIYLETFLDEFNFQTANEMTIETFRAYSLYLGSIGYRIIDKCKVWVKVNQNLSTTARDFYKITQALEEANKVSNEYFILKWKHEDLIKKIVDEENLKLHESFAAFSLIDRYNSIGNQFANENSEFKNISNKMKKNSNYKELCDVNDKRRLKFLEYSKHFSNVSTVKNEVRKKIFSNKYYAVIKKYAENNIFISVDRTTWLPIEDETISYKDILDYFLLKDNIYLFSVYNLEDDGTISYKVNRDLKMAMNEIELENYSSSCRIICSLIDNNHKSLSEAFNGFSTTRKNFKNGKERSEEITKLFTQFKYYEEQWIQLDECIKKINNGSGFVNRNDLIHGIDVEVDKYDCIKLVLLFINLNYLKDDLRNLSEVFEGYLEASTLLKMKENNHE